MTICCTVDVELDMCDTIISENVIDFLANASWTIHSTYHTVFINLTANGTYMRHFSVSFTVAYITLLYSVQYSYMAIIIDFGYVGILWANVTNWSTQEKNHLLWMWMK